MLMIPCERCRPQPCAQTSADSCATCADFETALRLQFQSVRTRQKEEATTKGGQSRMAFHESRQHFAPRDRLGRAARQTARRAMAGSRSVRIRARSEHGGRADTNCIIERRLGMPARAAVAFDVVGRCRRESVKELPSRLPGKLCALLCSGERAREKDAIQETRPSLLEEATAANIVRALTRAC